MKLSYNEKTNTQTIDFANEILITKNHVAIQFDYHEGLNIKEKTDLNFKDLNIIGWDKKNKLKTLIKLIKFIYSK